MKTVSTTDAGETTSRARGGWRLARPIVERSRIALRSLPCAWTYAALGAILALGAPLGLLLARAMDVGLAPSAAWARGDIARFMATYLYVTVSAGVALPALGYLLGRQYDRARLLAVTDPLTGLHNRRHFGERLTAELARGRRYGHTTCVLCVDVDHLKAINDDLGHGAGDRALVAVGRNLSSSARASDVVARMGGDEFAVLLPETEAFEASALSQRVLAEAARQSPRSAPLRISIGVASSSASADMAAEGLLLAADAALYMAKAGGGNRVVVDRPTPSPGREPITLTEAAVLVRRSRQTEGSRT